MVIFKKNKKGTTTTTANPNPKPEPKFKPIKLDLQRALEAYKTKLKSKFVSTGNSSSKDSVSIACARSDLSSMNSHLPELICNCSKASKRSRRFKRCRRDNRRDRYADEEECRLCSD